MINQRLEIVAEHAQPVAKFNFHDFLRLFSPFQAARESSAKHQHGKVPLRMHGFSYRILLLFFAFFVSLSFLGRVASRSSKQKHKHET